MRESNESIGNENKRFYAFCEHFEDHVTVFVYLNICFHWLSFTLKPLSINISRSSSIKNQGPLRTKIIFKYFQGLEIGLLKFKGFQGFSRCVRTLLLGLV